MIGSVARTGAREAVAADKPFNAPLFKALIDAIPDHQRWVVLDLGKVCPQVITLFGGHRCRVEIAEVAQELELLNRDLERDALDHVAEGVLPPTLTEPVDLVLCWDTLNYLNRDALRALMWKIADRSRPGTRVHALIYYADPQMPNVPGHYVPHDDGTLTNRAAVTGQRPAPRYTPEDLRLCMPAFRSERAMLLGNGMQEFLFRV